MRPPLLPRRSIETYLERPRLALGFGVAMVVFAALVILGSLLVVASRGIYAAPAAFGVLGVLGVLYGGWFIAWAGHSASWQ